MNWQTFKTEVERQGVKDTDEINYIDLYPDDGVHVGREANGAVVILDAGKPPAENE